jgi:hypothetical protein
MPPSWRTKNKENSKNSVFWDVKPYGSCKNPRFGEHPNDGGDTFFRNVGSYNSHTTSHARRRHSSESPPWKPQILHGKNFFLPRLNLVTEDWNIIFNGNTGNHGRWEPLMYWYLQAVHDAYWNDRTIAWYRRNTLDLYSEGPRFGSTFGHRIICFRILDIFSVSEGNCWDFF